MQTLKEISGLRAALRAHRKHGRRIALVPTMGNLHAGHLALIHHARCRADVVVASLFVNPTQFGPNEDLDAYPRTLEADQTLLAEAGCDLLFTPNSASLYPSGTAKGTRVQVPDISEGLCGDCRPGHFEGVATVVTLLFHLVQPDLACFGEKDFQQLAVIRKLVRDLHLPIGIESVPTVRADDGLALSSRNGYLDTTQRRQASALYRILRQIGQALESGQTPEQVLQQGRKDLYDAGLEPEYLELRERDLQPFSPATQEAIILAAVRLGSTRLIDNLTINLKPQFD